MFHQILQSYDESTNGITEFDSCSGYRYIFHATSLIILLQDVAWHLLHESLFGSVADDQKLMM